MTDRPKQVVVLGSTGSIGVSTLDVIARHPDRYQVFALTAQRNGERLLEQCLRFQPQYAVLVDEEAALALRRSLAEQNCRTEVLMGRAALVEVAAHGDVDAVMAAIVGAAGLEPTLAAVRAGKRVLLANKEALVMSGELFMSAVRTSGAELLPIDSEHNAIFQCLPRVTLGQKEPGDTPNGLLGKLGVRRILLTASGGPFRATPLEELDSVTPEQACRHPNWSMGQKISVDSATMMNKGLELIEACWLFDATPDQVDIHIHPESVIHSMVEYCDGSVLAQMGNPDMRTPIASGLAWPERIESGVGLLDLFKIGALHFERPDTRRFPCLRLAAEAFSAGGTAAAVLNAANEEAVAAFLDRRIRFTRIPAIIEQALVHIPVSAADSVDAVLQADQRAREYARQIIQAGP